MIDSDILPIIEPSNNETGEQDGYSGNHARTPARQTE